MATTHTKARIRKARRVLLIALIVTALVVLIEEADFRVRVPQVYSSSPNAIWVRHTWLDEPHTDTDYRALVTRMRDLNIRDAYFHAGPMRPDGSVDPTKFSRAAVFITHIRKLAPEIRLQPWLGQMAEFGGAKPIDLSSSRTRAAVINTARKFLDAGAQGIHYDLEPTFSGDKGFIELLRSTRKLTHARGSVLSVAAYPPEPIPYAAKAARLLTRCPGYWTRRYFLEVSREVDQIAVMTYDTAIPLPGVYGRSIERTVRWCSEHGVRNLLIGVPTYEAGGPAHSARVENITSALNGLKRGIAELKPERRERVGAAIFAEWTTSDAERKVFRQLWLGKQQASSKRTKGD